MAGARLSAEQRRRQIIEAARWLLVEQGGLPLAPERLAGEIGASKALVYSHFPDQHRLFNAVLDEEFALLAQAGLDAASAAATLTEAAQASAELYFRHVSAHGPAIHIILRDRYMARRARSASARLRDRIARRLARLARRELGLSAREAVAAFSIALAIPEEAGRLVWQGDLTPAAGEELCRRLTLAAVQGLQPERPSSR